MLLPEAFRSLSRLSSALSAKASAIRSYQHNQLALSPTGEALGYTCIALHALVVDSFFPGCLPVTLSGLVMFVNITSDVLIVSFLFDSILLIVFFFKINEYFFLRMQFSRCTIDSFQNQVENTRVELVTSCLQGRRSPN